MMDLMVRLAERTDAVAAGIAQLGSLCRSLEGGWELSDAPNTPEMAWAQDRLIQRWHDRIVAPQIGERLAVAMMGHRLVGCASVKPTEGEGRTITDVRRLELEGVWIDPQFAIEIGVGAPAPNRQSFIPLWERSEWGGGDLVQPEIETLDPLEPDAASVTLLPDSGVLSPKQIIEIARVRLLEYVLPGLAPAQTWVWREDGESRDFYRDNGFTLDGMSRLEPELGVEMLRLVR
ncbi:hypothetical protein BK816_06325 [Boudabousia tangfeifanii]|uniref:Uncharacterized protein n=1 Tax=Boudabousia tangfeifanii TaxID=1912795 RepID=A0A1D9MLA0_9ACTO|nr:hypothetical protein [Boudabousia tangfeifanii]AOZ72953.1 hypothetical protein BK816_06325 [Boudabousia tangfeifanii]